MLSGSAADNGPGKRRWPEFRPSDSGSPTTITTARPIVAEGWGLRPELVAPVTSELRRMVLLVPTEEFRRAQISRLPRAAALSRPVDDPEAAQRHRMERDRLVASDAVRSAGKLGVRVIRIDGSRDAEAVADLVAEQFREFL
jgi:hypothetical protein